MRCIASREEKEADKQKRKERKVRTEKVSEPEKCQINGSEHTQSILRDNARVLNQTLHLMGKLGQDKTHKSWRDNSRT